MRRSTFHVSSLKQVFLEKATYTLLQQPFLSTGSNSLGTAYVITRSGNDTHRSIHASVKERSICVALS